MRLTAENITKSFGAKQVLKGIDLSVESGLDALLHQILQQHRVHRIEARKRLVEDHDLRITDERCHKLNFLLVAL